MSKRSNLLSYSLAAILNAIYSVQFIQLGLHIASCVPHPNQAIILMFDVKIKSNLCLVYLSYLSLVYPMVIGAAVTSYWGGTLRPGGQLFPVSTTAR